MKKKKSSLTRALQNAQHQQNKNIKLTKRLAETKPLSNHGTKHTTRAQATHQPTSVGKNQIRTVDEPIKSSIRTEKSMRRPLTMVDKNDKVLLVGEGNFSFTVALIINQLHPGQLITASTIDSKQTVLEKYPDASKFLTILEENQVTILFELDGCKLHEDKRIKNIIREHKFDKVIFNFPHVGGSEADQDRSIRANQILILRFLRSVATILFQNKNQNDQTLMITRKAPKSSKSGSNKSNYEHSSNHQRNLSMSSDSGSDNHPSNLEDSDLELNIQSQKPGSVLITTGTCTPYSLWNVPKLAKNGKILAHTILYPSHPSLKIKGEQPNYKIIRSFDFDQFIAHLNDGHHSMPANFDNDAPSPLSITYQHRQTNGFKNLNNKDSKPCSPRTWEFQLIL